MWSRHNCAIPIPDMCVEQGRKSAALEHPWLMIVRMASSPFCTGRPVIRSMAMTWNGGMFSSVGMQYSGMCFL